MTPLKAANQRMIDEMMSGHNTECDFYDQFSSRNAIPMPKSWHSEHSGEGNPGLIFMEFVEGVPQNFAVNLSILQVSDCSRLGKV